MYSCRRLLTGVAARIASSLSRHAQPFGSFCKTSKIVPFPSGFRALHSCTSALSNWTGRECSSSSAHHNHHYAHLHRLMTTKAHDFSEALKTEPTRAPKINLHQDEKDSNVWHSNEDVPEDPVTRVQMAAAEPRVMLAMTCKPCGTRLVKSMSKKSYTKGVVIIRCDHCRAMHLIADHLGWFDDQRITIEDIMREKGESVTKGKADEGELSEELKAKLEATYAAARASDLDAPIMGVVGMKAREQKKSEKE